MKTHTNRFNAMIDCENRFCQNPRDAGKVNFPLISRVGLWALKFGTHTPQGHINFFYFPLKIHPERR